MSGIANCNGKKKPGISSILYETQALRRHSIL